MKTINKIKQLSVIILFIVSTGAFSQVGIGTTSPQTTLQIDGVNAATTGILDSADGVVVPRVTDADMASAASGTVAGQLVFNSTLGSFYYWTGSSWGVAGASATPTFRSDSVGSVSAADINNYITVGANNVYDVSGITATTGDKLTFIGTGTGFSINGLPAGQSTAPPIAGGGITLVYDGTDWLNLNSF